MSSVEKISGVEPYFLLGNALMRIVSAPARLALWAHVKDFAAQFGCSEFTAIDALRLAGGLVDAVLDADTSTFPILTAIEEEGLTRSHPVLDRCMKAAESFKLSEIRDDPSQLGKRWAELMSEVSIHGDVLIVPVYADEDLKAVFAFGGEKPDLCKQTRLMLEVISYAAFARIDSVNPRVEPRSAYKLTVREIQCLRWLAMGKTDADIGEILGISPRTARFHAENAKTKLSVATRTQAVAKAVNERLIKI